LYYLLIASLTSAILLVVLLAVIFFSLRITNAFAIIVVALLLIWELGMSSGLAWWLYRKGLPKETAIKTVGRYLGRFYGIFIGLFIGIGLLDLPGQWAVIVSISWAIAFYFIGRWAGGWLSLWIGKQLDKIFSIPEPKILKTIDDNQPTMRFAKILFMIFLPWLSVITGFALDFSKVQHEYLKDLLPIGRMAAFGISIIALLVPWLVRRGLLIHLENVPPERRDLVIIALGLAFSMVPAIYGFLLFIAFGATLIELICFALVSSLAAVMLGNVYLKQAVQR
jgi:hypothetical protein